MTQRKSVSIVIQTNQTEAGDWAWTCVINDELAGMGVGEDSREVAQQVALDLVNTLMGSES